VKFMVTELPRRRGANGGARLGIAKVAGDPAASPDTTPGVVLGTVSYECLIGAPPFAHVTEPVPTFEKKGRSVDPELEAIVRWMLEKEIGSRPASATAVLSRAERLLAKLSPPPRTSAPKSPPPGAPPSASRAASASSTPPATRRA